LDALVAVGLLERTGGSYRLAPLAREFLNRGKPSYLGRFLTTADVRWTRLGAGLRTGEPQNGARPGASMVNRPADRREPVTAPGRTATTDRPRDAVGPPTRQPHGAFLMKWAHAPGEVSSTGSW
jgi:hypothetical protein